MPATCPTFTGAGGPSFPKRPPAMAATRTAIHMSARVSAVAPDSRSARRNKPSASHGSTRGSASVRFDSRQTASCSTPGSLLLPAESKSHRTGLGIEAKSVRKPFRMTKNSDTSPEQRDTLVTSGLQAMAAVHRVDWRAAGLDWLAPAGGAAPGTAQQLALWREYAERELEGRPFPELDAAFAWVADHL